MLMANLKALRQCNISQKIKKVLVVHIIMTNLTERSDHVYVCSLFLPWE